MVFSVEGNLLTIWSPFLYDTPARLEQFRNCPSGISVNLFGKIAVESETQP